MATFEEVLADVDAECRKRTIPMLGHEKAELLAQLIEEKRPELVVECGTAIGYSGLWIARSLRKNGKGRLITIERDPERSAEARANFERAGVADLVEARVGDAREVLETISDPVDFLHLDNGYANYYPCFRTIESRLTDGAILLADNVAIGEEEMRDYLDHVRTHFESTTHWFDTDLPWVPRDAMEVTIYRRSG